MHGFSTLDARKPGDPSTLLQSATRMAEFLRGRNPKVEIYLTATWSRADMTYPAGTPWKGKKASPSRPWAATCARATTRPPPQ